MLPSAPKTSPTHSPSPDSSKLAASVSSTPASTAIFYGSSSPAKSLGSTHTKYYAPPSDSIPAVATAAVFHQPQPQQPSHTPHWTEGYQPNPEGWRAPEAVPLDAVSTSGVANPEDRQWGYNSPDFRAIDMTVLEGPQWWDKEGQNRLPYKPGPGLLPPGVEELVHADGHSLYQVSIIPPEIPPMSPPPSAQSFPSSTSSVPATPPPTPPSTAEINEAIPSPHALFCRECNGWIVIATRNAAIPPVTSDVAPDALPDPSARKSVKCDEHDSIWSPLSIRTHHYHRKLRAVDGSSLTPPLTASSLEPTLPSTISGTTSPAPDTANDDRMETDDPKKEDAALKLDLFACCQCQTNVYVSSDVIPGMIPTSLLNEFSGDKEAHPPLGKTREASVLIAWETILGCGLFCQP